MCNVETTGLENDQPVVFQTTRLMVSESTEVLAPVEDVGRACCKLEEEEPPDADVAHMVEVMVSEGWVVEEPAVSEEAIILELL